MTSWQDALLAERKINSRPKVPVINQEYLDDDRSNPQAGWIEQHADRLHYDVVNVHTKLKREGIAQGEVEQALVDLNISNSSWV